MEPGDKPSEVAGKGGHGFLFVVIFCFVFLFVFICCALLCFGLSAFCFLTSLSLSFFLSESVHVCAASCAQTCMYACGQRTVLGVVHVASTLQ